MKESVAKNNGRDFDRLLLDQIADRWTILVLGAICTAERSGMRFNALRREIDGISQKTLTQCLRRLERNGLVERHLIDGAPPGVEYVITVLGHTLDKPFDALNAWTSKHAGAVRAAQAAFDARAQVVRRQRLPSDFAVNQDEARSTGSVRALYARQLRTKRPVRKTSA
jgi:DNA-binding HxlR family transcriptional regulator